MNVLIKTDFFPTPAPRGWWRHGGDTIPPARQTLLRQHPRNPSSANNGDNWATIISAGTTAHKGQSLRHVSDSKQDDLR